VAGATFGREEERAGQERGRGWWQQEPLTAGEIMTPDVKTVTRQTPIRDVSLIMRNENVGAVPVVDEQSRLIGIVTDRDIVVRGLMGDKLVQELRAEDVMTDDVEAVSTDDKIHDVIELMGRKQVRRMPVVGEEKRLVGIVSIGDLASRADYDEELQDALEKISSKRSFWSRLWR
jgi:CBS domain-containing protein